MKKLLGAGLTMLTVQEHIGMKSPVKMDGLPDTLKLWMSGNKRLNSIKKSLMNTVS
jgi:hypothetical protein